MIGIGFGSLFKIAIGAALAVLIVRYAGRKGVVHTIIEDRFDSRIAPNAPF